MEINKHKYRIVPMDYETEEQEKIESLADGHTLDEFDDED